MTSLLFSFINVQSVRILTTHTDSKLHQISSILPTCTGTDDTMNTSGRWWIVTMNKSYMRPGEGVDGKVDYVTLLRGQWWARCWQHDPGCCWHAEYYVLKDVVSLCPSHYDAFSFLNVIQVLQWREQWVYWNLAFFPLLSPEAASCSECCGGTHIRYINTKYTWKIWGGEMKTLFHFLIIMVHVC